MKLKVLFFLIPLSLLACSGKKMVKQDEITAALTKTMCHKMLECQPQSMPNEEYCNTMMHTAIAGSLQKFNVSETSKNNLDNCVKSINKSTCDGLQAQEPPKECSFLKP